MLSPTYFHLEVVKGVFIDVFHLVHHPHGIISQRADVRTSNFVVRGVVEARGGHVGGADGLNLLQLAELIFTNNLMMVGVERLDQPAITGFG